MGLPLWKLYDILKHTEEFIFNVLYIGYMYTYTHKKIYHVYILEYIIGDMEKQYHQGLKVSLLHSLHVARHTLATMSSTTQVCYIKILRHCTSLHSKFFGSTATYLPICVGDAMCMHVAKQEGFPCYFNVAAGQRTPKYYKNVILLKEKSTVEQPTLPTGQSIVMCTNNNQKGTS